MKRTTRGLVEPLIEPLKKIRDLFLLKKSSQKSTNGFSKKNYSGLKIFSTIAFSSASLFFHSVNNSFAEELLNGSNESNGQKDLMSSGPLQKSESKAGFDRIRIFFEQKQILNFASLATISDYSTKMNYEQLFLLLSILDYEKEKREKSADSLDEDIATRKIFYELEARDRSEIPLVLLDKNFRPSPYNTLAHFIRNEMKDENSVFFSSYFEDIQRAGLDTIKEGALKKEQDNYIAYSMTKQYRSDQKSFKNKLKDEAKFLEELAKFLRNENKEKKDDKIFQALNEKFISIMDDNDNQNYLTALSVFIYLGEKQLNSEQSPNGSNDNDQITPGDQSGSNNKAKCAYKSKNDTGFSPNFKYNETNMLPEFKKTLTDTLAQVKVIANNKDFKKAVKKRNYVGYDGDKVLSYIDRAIFDMNVSVSMNVPYSTLAVAGVCSNYMVFNGNRQDRKGPRLAATIFHETTHALGFLHSSNVPYPLGDVMADFYSEMFPMNNNELRFTSVKQAKELAFVKKYVMY